MSFKLVLFLESTQFNKITLSHYPSQFVKRGPFLFNNIFQDKIRHWSIYYYDWKGFGRPSQVIFKISSYWVIDLLILSKFQCSARKK